MTGGVVDPGDPFEAGSVRFEARARLLRAIDALLDSDCPPGTPEWAERFAEVREARARWALFGRDGE